MIEQQINTQKKRAIEFAKRDIAAQAETQKSLKAQRKTVHFKGVRTVEPWQAFYMVQSNRQELAHKYIAYALLRGKDIDKYDPDWKTRYSMSYVQKFLDYYNEQFVHLDQK